MNAYQVLIPIASLLLGVLVLTISEITDRKIHSKQVWLLHTLVLGLALFQQILLYRIPSSLFARGGLISDGTTQVFSLCVLLLSFLIQINRKNRTEKTRHETSILSLGVTLFALFAIEANRIFFGIVALLGMIWLAHAALASETKIKERTSLLYSGVVRSLIFLIVGIILSILVLNVFGESQMDEIQRVIVRGSIRGFSIFVIQIFIIFIGALILGIPPFDGIFGHSRKNASWALSLGFTGIFAIVGIDIFLRWGILVFTRPAIGTLDIEPLTQWNILHIIRLISVVGLVLTPVFAIISQTVRKSFLFFILNPFVQCLFSLSFGQREVLGVAIAQLLVAVVMIGLIISSMEALNFEPTASIKMWLSMGRKEMMGCLSLILALSSAAGLAPFYGSLLVQKTLSINSGFGLVLLFNVVISGFFVGRLLTLAFHRSEDLTVSRVSSSQKVWMAAQFILLIFMGIFWQSLYKYGAFSIRQFFGEV
jgi:hypothetical protein